MTKSGTCLCGGVTIIAEVFPTMQACHCGTCRTWSGGPFLATPSKAEPQITGTVARYASSDIAERGFCPACGTHLFYHHNESGMYAIPVGLFEDQSDLPFRAEIYVDERPDYYVFGNHTKQMTGAEFEAKFRAG